MTTPAEPANSDTDDLSIAGDEILYRRVPPQAVKRSPTTGLAERAGSGDFEDSDDGTPCSIFIRSKLDENGLGLSDVLKGYEGKVGVAEFSAQDARDAGFGVVHRPDEEGGPAHGGLTGKKTQGARKKLAKATRIVVQPPPDPTR